MLYLPHEKLDSVIISYDLYVAFWQFLPEFVRIREPKLIFRATQHGYNLRTFYNMCEDHSDSYFFCLILIRSTEGAIMGCLIDDMPVPTSKNVFQGGSDAFVFSLAPTIKQFRYTAENDFQMLADLNYLAIGMGGDGPALRVDMELKTGRSYRSLTYDNDVLTGKDGAL